MLPDTISMRLRMYCTPMHAVCMHVLSVHLMHAIFVCYSSVVSTNQGSTTLDGTTQGQCHRGPPRIPVGIHRIPLVSDTSLGNREEAVSNLLWGGVAHQVLRHGD